MFVTLQKLFLVTDWAVINQGGPIILHCSSPDLNSNRNIQMLFLLPGRLAVHCETFYQIYVTKNLFLALIIFKSNVELLENPVELLEKPVELLENPKELPQNPVKLPQNPVELLVFLT